MMALVTVIIPCHNSEELVERAINSVLAQSYPHIELLLVENNSTDNTLAMLKKFEAKHPDKIAVHSEKRKGACAARNLGLSKAQGQWIQFLDADDELLPQKIENQMAIVSKSNPDIVVDDYLIMHSVTKKPHINVIAEDGPWIGVIKSNLGITSSNLWRKTSLLKVNGWDEELGSSQEYDMLFRLLQLNCKIAVNHQVNTIIHAQVNSISRTRDDQKLLKMYINRYSLRRKIYEFLHKNNLLNEVYKRNLLHYMYYYLLLIRELNMPFFEDQVKKFDFQSIGIADRVKILLRSILNSSQRKHGRSNIVLKAFEWKYFFLKNLHLIRF